VDDGAASSTADPESQPVEKASRFSTLRTELAGERECRLHTLTPALSLRERGRYGVRGSSTVGWMTAQPHPPQIPSQPVEKASRFSTLRTELAGKRECWLRALTPALSLRERGSPGVKG